MSKERINRGKFVNVLSGLEEGVSREAQDLLEGAASGTIESAQEARQFYNDFRDFLQTYREDVQRGRMKAVDFAELKERREAWLRKSLKAIANEELRAQAWNFIDAALRVLESLAVGAAKAIGLPISS